MSSERQAFNDGFDKGFSKSLDKIAQLEAEIVVAWDSDRAARVFNVEYSGRAQKAEAENEALRREKKNLKEALEAYAIGGGHEWAGLRDENAALKRELEQLKYSILILPNGKMVSVVWLKRHLLGPKSDEMESALLEEQE